MYGRRPGTPAYVESPNHDHVIFMHSCDMSGDNGRCLACGLLTCPHGEPLHFHPKGCPRCEPERATRRPYARGDAEID